MSLYAADSPEGGTGQPAGYAKEQSPSEDPLDGVDPNDWRQLCSLNRILAALSPWGPPLQLVDDGDADSREQARKKKQ